MRYILLILLAGCAIGRPQKPKVNHANDSLAIKYMEMAIDFYGAGNMDSCVYYMEKAKQLP